MLKHEKQNRKYYEQKDGLYENGAELLSLNGILLYI